LFFWQCAQVSPLTGGERDTQPPKIKEAIPQNASVNFSSKTIELSFDEFVQVKDIANQLVVTPQTKEKPDVEARGKKIIIKFNEELQPNTTYRIFFGNAIADMHETNILSNYEYVFSTGPVIDSLEIRGKVINASDLKPEKDVTVGLYDNNEDDSVVFRKKPLYFTKTAEGGNYKLSYLPKASFKTYAFTDKNKNLMYDAGEEMAAFKGEPVSTLKDTINDMILFREESSRTFLKRSFSPFYGLAYIIYNKEQNNIVKAYYGAQKEDIVAKDGMNDTAIVYFRNIYDTIRLLVEHPGKKTDSVSIMVAGKEKFDRMKKDGKHILNIDLVPLQGVAVPYYIKPSLQFSNWINADEVDQNKMELVIKGDSVKRIPLKLGKASVNAFRIENTLVPGNEYAIILGKGAFKSMIGVESDSAKFAFKTSEASDYAILNLKLLLPKKENYIVQLLNDRSSVIAEQYLELSLTSSAEQTLKFKDLLPGNYFVRVTEDKNGNKKWDTGNVLKKEQPEINYFNAQAIKLLADWDSETEWKVE
jgi:hypothetical protein